MFPNPRNSGQFPIPARAKFQAGYDEAVVGLGSVSGFVRINVSRGNYFVAKVVANTTFVFEGVPPPGRLHNWQLELINGGAFTVAFAGATLVWTDAGSVPTLRSSGYDLLTFYTRLGAAKVRALRSDTSATA